MKSAIEQLKSEALLLVANHNEMEAYSIHQEASILWAQIVLLRSQLAKDTQMGLDELEEADSLLERAESAMHLVSDACEVHHSNFTTQL